MLPLILIFSFTYSSTVFAQGGVNGSGINTDGSAYNINTINTAVPFLRIDPDARSGAMGDVGIAISGDANSIYWNTAKIPFTEKNTALSVTYTPWLKELVSDIFLADISAYKKLDENQGITASLRYFSLGSITFTNIQGQVIGNFNPREFTFSGGYARKIAENFSTGVNLSYIYSNLAAGQSVSGVPIKAGTAAAADISFFYHKDTKFGKTKGDYNIGLTISNIGNKITYTQSAENKDFIPTNMGLGAGINFKFDDYNSLMFAGEINKLLVPTPDIAGLFRTKSVPSGLLGSFSDAPGGGKEEFHELMFSVGSEYWYKNQFAIRAGYFNEHSTKGNRKYLTAGVGIKYNVFGLNFSYLIPTSSQKNPLDNTLRFSLLFEFDKTKTAPNTTE
ncbi:MAG: hypothetical protein D4R43_04195 [Sphingobacteriales bacterium]|nr:MAG: hypothetical protein D4R43_04195 [Sphingobacteriales bacterium]